MSTKMFKRQDIQAAVWGEGATPADSPLVLEEAGQWVDEGKYQRQENTLRDTGTGLFYLYLLSKSGSYFSDFTYSFEWEKDEIELVEVIKTTKTIEIWVAREDS